MVEFGEVGRDETKTFTVWKIVVKQNSGVAARTEVQGGGTGGSRRGGSDSSGSLR